MRTRLPLAALAAVLTLPAACSGGGDGGTQPGPTPAIAISLSPASATVAQGGSTPVGVTVTRSGGFTGTVNLTVGGAPSGVSGTVAAPQTSGGVTTAAVTVAVDAATAPGTYTLTVQASGSGVSSASASFALTVTAAAAYTLAATPATLSVVQGTAGTVSVAIARTSFTGNITLAAENLPAGVTAGFSPNPADGASSTLTLTASAGATLGATTVTVRGTATGLADRTVTVALTVTAGGGSGNVAVDFSNCGTLLGFPIWVAYQDGNGAWTRATGTANVYRFTINQSKGAVAWTTGSGVYIWLMTRAELTNGIQACETAGTKRVTGTVAGVTASDYPRVSLGNSQSPTILGGAWTIDRVLNGPQDLIGYRQSQTTPRVGERAVIRRDLDIPNNGSAGVVDFDGAESFAPVAATVTVNGLVGDDQLVSQMNYLSTSGCSLAHLHSGQGLTSPFPTTGIPAAQQRGTDFHHLMVTGNSPTLGTRSVQHSFNLLGDRTVTLPPPVSPPAVTVLAGSYRRLQAVIGVPAEYDSHTTFAYWQGVAGSPMQMLATAAWVGGTSATLAFPDLGGVAGWNNAWAAAAGAAGNWALLVAGKSMGFAGNLCVEGGLVRSAQRHGTH